MKECITHFGCDCLIAEVEKLRVENEKLKAELDDKNRRLDLYIGMDTTHGQRVTQLRSQLAIARDTLEWIVPKVHHAHHDRLLDDCQKSICRAYRETLEKLGDEK